MNAATFADGTTVTHTSKRAATVAWRLVYPSGRIEAGNGTGQRFAFSKDAATAEKSAKSTAAFFRKYGTDKREGGAPRIEIVAAI
jgi:hypothetical protein